MSPEGESIKSDDEYVDDEDLAWIRLKATK
jgi:hypothetical protein